MLFLYTEVYFHPFKIIGGSIVFWTERVKGNRYKFSIIIGIYHSISVNIDKVVSILVMKNGVYNLVYRYLCKLD